MPELVSRAPLVRINWLNEVLSPIIRLPEINVFVTPERTSHTAGAVPLLPTTNDGAPLLMTAPRVMRVPPLNSKLPRSRTGLSSVAICKPQPTRLPESGLASSAMYSRQVPLGLAPLKEERVTEYGPTGAGLGMVSPGS